MSDNTEMVFFPELSSLDSDKLRVLRDTKASLQRLGDDYAAIEKCHEILQTLTKTNQYFGDENENAKNMILLCNCFIIPKLTDAKINLQGILIGLYNDIDSAIYSAEFVALEEYRMNLTAHLQQQLRDIPDSENNNMSSALIQFFQLSSYDLTGRIYHFYKQHYPHYTIK